MAPKHQTRDALLVYLRADTEPRPIERVLRYMRIHHGVRPHATREQLRRLTKAGMVAKTEAGYSAGTSAGAGELEQTRAD